MSVNIINEINEMANQTQSIELAKKSAHITSLALVYALTAAAGAKDLFTAANSKAASVKKAAPVDPANTDTTDYAAQLQALIAAYGMDPTNMAKGLALIEFIITLSQKGLLSGSTPESQTLIKMLNSADVTDLLNVLGNEAALAYASGGDAGAMAFLTKILNLINAVPAKNDNSFLDQIKANITLLMNGDHYGDKNFVPPNFYIDPKTGHLMYTSPITGQVYDCTNPTDLAIIQMLISASGSSTFPNPFWKNFKWGGEERAYMLDTLDAMLKQYGTGAIMMIIAYILNAKDQEFQDQMSGYANTTNDLDDLTNQYITPLETLWANVGNWSPQDATTFFKDLTAATEIIGSTPGMQGFSSTWMNSVFGQITGTSITWKDSSGDSHTDTIAGILAGIKTGKYTSQDLAAAINSLNPAPSGSTPPQPNPAYQMINNALMEGGGLVTQQSKMIGTLAAAVSNMDDQCIKLFAGFVDKSGSGLVALIFNIINNFKSS